MEQKKIILSASILAGKLTELGAESKAVVHAGIDWIHIDIMDNHFVPNLTFGPWICQALRDDGINVPLDVHLMADPVDDLIFRCADAGATSITVHVESVLHLDRTIKRIKELGCQAAIALNPATSLSTLDYILPELDMVLIMAVNPGFAGQVGIEYCQQKVATLRDKINKINKPIRLAVDGGIQEKTIKQYYQAGADTFVVGAGLFHSKDYKQTVQDLYTAAS